MKRMPVSYRTFSGLEKSDDYEEIVKDTVGKYSILSYKFMNSEYHDNLRSRSLTCKWGVRGGGGVDLKAVSC